MNLSMQSDSELTRPINRKSKADKASTYAITDVRKFWKTTSSSLVRLEHIYHISKMFLDLFRNLY